MRAVDPRELLPLAQVYPIILGRQRDFAILVPLGRLLPPETEPLRRGYVFCAVESGRQRVVASSNNANQDYLREIGATPVLRPGHAQRLHSLGWRHGGASLSITLAHELAAWRTVPSVRPCPLVASVG